MSETELQEKLLSAWVGLNGSLKDSRMTKEMTYNEAIIMRIVLERYRTDGVGITPVQQIIRETNMLKSLVNRTINALCDKGYLTRLRDESDKRNISVVPIVERLPLFLDIHNRSLKIAADVIGIIGKEDAEVFIRISEKIVAAVLELP